MERKRRISAPFLRTGLNNYRQSKTAVQPENTIIALIQAGIADNIFSPIILGFPDSYKSILAVSKDSYQYPCRGDLAGIWIDELCRITGPIYFDLLTRFPWDAHDCPALFFLFLGIIEELRIHGRFFLIHATLFTVFYS